MQDRLQTSLRTPASSRPRSQAGPARWLRALAGGGLALALVTACSSGQADLQAETESFVDSEAPGTISGSTPDTSAASSEALGSPTDDDMTAAPSSPQTLTLGAGCFWCVEAVLEQIEGIQNVVSGYMGGEVENPTYKQVCTGSTGHTEVVQVTYDPAVLPTEHVLAWFWKLHDPTTLNRQGADIGTQYRSAIYYHTEAQREAAEASMAAAAADFSDPIVTEITPASTFYVAEDYHQDYYRANKSQGYCRAVIAPKLEKLKLEK